MIITRMTKFFCLEKTKKKKKKEKELKNVKSFVSFVCLRRIFYKKSSVQEQET